MEFGLIIPAFLAGLLTFLAPCTLPMVPGYLAFISGVSLNDLRDPEKSAEARKKVFYNGLLYVLGFSLVFITLGSLFGLGGSALAKYRAVFSQVGGAFVIIFGLYILNIFKLPFLDTLNVEKKVNLPGFIKPGNPRSSFIFGLAFALGWTPCVGPILGSILLLASTTTTILQGAFLLTVFSLGLAVPFIAIALGIGSASNFLNRISKYLSSVSFIGGVFLIFLGILLLTNNMGLWISYVYQLLEFTGYNRLLEYL